MRRLALVPILCFALLPQISRASLLNPGFESPAINLGAFNVVGIPGWGVDPNGSTGVWHIPTNGFFQTTAPEGLQIGYTNTTLVAQQSTNILSVGTNTASCMGGRRHDDFSGSFRLKLWAGGLQANGVVTGGTLLASSDFIFTSIPIDTFTPVSASYTAAPGDPNLGKFITVQLERIGGSQLCFDDVQISSPSAERVTVSSVTVNLGRVTSGGVAELAIDDNTPLTICKFFIPTVTSPFVQIVVSGQTTQSTVSGITLRALSKLSNAGSFQETLRLFNFVTSSYEESSTAPANNVSTAYAVAGTGNVSRYVGPNGALQGQIQVKQSGFSAVTVPCANFDLINWYVSP